MQDPQLTSYLHWAHQRGLRYPMLRPQSSPHPRIQFTSHTALSNEETALVEKIAQAMKLTTVDYVVNTFADCHPNAPITIYLGNTPPNLVCTPGDLQSLDGVSYIMLTDHPGQLLKDPSRKRAVWQHMQFVMQRLLQ